MFSVPASGLRGAQREDLLLLTCCRSAPVMTSGLDFSVLEARWAVVRDDYWCGDWSGDGAVVTRP